jgi:hypothetical protein
MHQDEHVHVGAHALDPRRYVVAPCYVAGRQAAASAVLDDQFFIGGSDLADAEVMSGARR